MFTQKPKDYRVLKDDKKTVRWLDYVQEMRMLNCKANIKVYWGKHNLRILIAHESDILEAMEQYAEQERKRPYLKKAKESSIKICAGCGSFAHGNSGHDIT